MGPKQSPPGPRNSSMNGPSRTLFVAILIAAGVGVLATAAYSVRGVASGNVFAGGGAGTVFAAKSFTPIAAGNAPRVTIDDPNSGVTISASNDGLVHVKDDTYFSGATLRSLHGYPQLTVTHDSDGVHISRAAYYEDWSMFIGFSNSRQHFEVQVPADSTVIVNECDNAEVSDLNNGANIKALGGHIALTNVEGAIVAHSNDGRITADRVASPSLDLSTSDGSVELRNFTATGNAPYARLHSGDGHINASGLFPANGKYDIATSDGHVTVEFAHGSDVTADASTNDGSLHVDGVRQHGDDSVQQTIHVGSGASPMRVHSDDGSITIVTNGTD